MIVRRLGLCLATVCLAAFASGCGDSNTSTGKRRPAPASGGGAPSATAPAAGSAAPVANAPAGGAPAAAGGWGTIKGKITWGKDTLPTPRKLDVTKDQPWCLAKGDVMDRYYVVDPESKGVAGIIVYVKSKVASIHPDYPQKKEDVKKADEKQFMEWNKVGYAELEKSLKEGKVKWEQVKANGLLDQVRCLYKPQTIAIREGMKMVVLNPEEIGHNVKVSDPNGANDGNNTMPPKTIQLLDWKASPQVNALECNVHAWMKGSALILDHPYYAVTGKDGTFEIKNVPSGDVTIQMRNEKYIDPVTGGVGKGAGYTIKLAPGETKEIPVKFQGE